MEWIGCGYTREDEYDNMAWADDYDGFFMAKGNGGHYLELKGDL